MKSAPEHIQALYEADDTGYTQEVWIETERMVSSEAAGVPS